MVKLRLLAPVVALVGSLLIPTVAGTSNSSTFPQGVASRAAARSVIIWTRASGEGSYDYQIATDRGFGDVVTDGTLSADPARDFTLKATVKRLKPSTRYFYRFKAGKGEKSSTGSFRTLPVAGKAAAMELAFSGDSDVLWEAGEPAPFAALKRIKEDHPDLFVYMGDTIYSDSETGSPPALTREEKWAKYRDNRIAATQALLKSVSTWAMWDDHEVINDFDGAVLSTEDQALLQAGVEAFSDYWPVPNFWPLTESRTYYRVDFGRNADLFFLDERMYRSQSADELDSPCRDSDGNLDIAPTMPEADRAALPGGGLPPVSPECLAHVLDPARTMLGAEQKQWLKDELQQSTARWKLIMNEVPLVQLFFLPYDRWEGYAAERTELLEFIFDNNIKGVVWLTTDIHAHIASPAYVDITAAEPVRSGWEIVTGPIQTCSLACEIDAQFGAFAHDVLKNFLIDRELIHLDDDGQPVCVEIDEFGYATVSLDKRARRLQAAWKSAEKGTNGGRPLTDCPALSIKP